MKKLILLFVLGFAVPAGAEVISTVSFNPSRMGNYDYLKVSNEATFKGGLVTGTDGTSGTMNIQSGGTVTMDLDGSTNYYKVDKVVGNANNVTVNMTSTTFRGGDIGNTVASGYKAQNAYSAGNLLPTVAVNGGTLDFATNNDSYVENLIGEKSNGEKTYQHYTKNLNPGQNAGTLKITGNAGNEIGLTKDGSLTPGSDGTTRGFHLAGVDIPYPTGDSVTAGLNAHASRSLCWVQRCTQDGQVAWVLSFVNGSSCPATKSGISCGTGGTEGLTWQISSSGWGSSDSDVASETCSSQENKIGCNNCCLQQGGAGYNLDSKTGTSCTTAGETYRDFDIREHPELAGHNGLGCHCSAYYITFVCK